MTALKMATLLPKRILNDVLKQLLNMPEHSFSFTIVKFTTDNVNFDVEMRINREI